MEYRDAESEEMRKLLGQITEGANSDRTPVSEVLRLCMRLAKQLHNEELLKWALSELNGYKGYKDLPDYRVQPSQVFGHFSGSFGSGLRNAHIPESVVDEKHRKMLFVNHMSEPVAELERLASKSGNETLQAYWSADAIAYYQRKEIYEGMALASAWRLMTKSSLTGVLDTVRTRILEFALKIDAEIKIQRPVHKDEKNKLVQPPPERVSQIIHATIYGGTVAVGNLGPTTQQTITVQPGDLKSLKKYLGELGVTPPLLR